MSVIYDLVIIGAGPAGITAAVYAARKRMNMLIISKDIGGQAAWSGDVENYTMTYTLILIYFYASALYLKDKTSIIVPSAVLAVGGTFHLILGILGPSLAYLHILVLKKKKSDTESHASVHALKSAD